MENIIKNNENIPLSDKDILDLTEGETKIVKYSELADVSHIDEILEPYKSCAILYEINPNFGHWVSLIKQGNLIEFMCPYGYPIDQALGFCYKYFPPFLSILLLNSGYKIIHSKYKFQKLKSNVSTCGRHVAFRIIMKEFPLNEYIKLFKGSKMNPDLQLCYLTAFLV